MLVSLSKLQEMVEELRKETGVPYHLFTFPQNVQLGYMTVTGQVKPLSTSCGKQEMAQVLLTMLNLEMCKIAARSDRDFVPANKDLSFTKKEQLIA